MSQKLDKVLEKITGAFNEDAPDEAEYPYAVFSARRISESDNKQIYSLEINVWDQNHYYSRAESMMDEIEQKLHRCNEMSDLFFIRIFNGQRQNVTDPDKTIKRVREQFEMHVYERKVD